ncbi:BamA/TamA family outer membrane protein [Coprobacter tertius]|uniref:BamA/TamA family outer membrane protein n=1 Tax=Coprobacter tertius TaxID=2944915 RepID=A0ABT1MK38_9BACT|nr:BamA/TamA family outer membrane protein [Coprobacter tertius]MCP9612734.1 BamA/TamA family outer membrane protein [Coprobacter tertius]
MKTRIFTGIMLLLLILMAACSTTSRLGEEEILYTGVKKIEITGVDSLEVPGNVKSAIKAPLLVKPNNSFLGAYWRTPFPIGLWVYNHMKPKKDKGFKHWFYEKFAKEPILISGVKPEVRVKVVDDILANYGYFGAHCQYELVYSKKNRKMAKIRYWVEVPTPSFYDSIEFPTPVTPLTELIDSLSKKSLIRKGAQYNLDTLSAERTRITTVARNKGYYYFRPEYIEYLADTTQKPKTVSLRMVLGKGIPAPALNAYKVGNVDVSLSSATGKGQIDSLFYKDLTVVYQKPMHLRKFVLPANITLKPGNIYSVEQQNLTQTNLSKLNIFRYVNLDVTPLDSLKGKDSLDVSIDAAFDVPLESEFEVDVSSKSNSFIGPQITFGVSKKNLFGAGEILAVKLNGSYEWQTGKKPAGAKSSLLNSYEFGLNGTLSFPRVLIPYKMQRKKNRRYPARTYFQLGADLMNRPHFFRMIQFNLSMNYDFQSSPYSFHTVTPVKLIYNKLLNTTSSFDNTLNENPAIALSFRNQFIPTVGYTYTFDRSFGRNGNNRIFWQTSATSAGNILAGIMDLAGKKGEKELFGNQFSQFIKGSTEFKYYRRLWGDNWLATRFLIGAGHAYGNSKVMPYSEQFYIGGANSIRAFTIRSLGPGSYRPPVNDPNGYFDQTGNFKLEANAEFRFKIIGGLHGAVFLDAGNIWLLQKDPKRPGGELQMKTFAKDIALGTGFGLRYDISYLVLRADLGIGIHSPYPNPEKSGYYNMSNFKNSLGFHLAIGYPF